MAEIDLFKSVRNQFWVNPSMEFQRTDLRTGALAFNDLLGIVLAEALSHELIYFNKPSFDLTIYKQLILNI